MHMGSILCVNIPNLRDITDRLIVVNLENPLNIFSKITIQLIMIKENVNV